MFNDNSPEGYLRRKHNENVARFWAAIIFVVCFVVLVAVTYSGAAVGFAAFGVAGMILGTGAGLVFGAIAGLVTFRIIIAVLEIVSALIG